MLRSKMNRHYSIAALAAIMAACAGAKNFPKAHYYPFHYKFTKKLQSDTLVFQLKNPLRCPVNIKITGDSVADDLRKRFGLIFLNAQRDTTVKMYYPQGSAALVKKIRYAVEYGRFDRVPVKQPVAYPFPAGQHHRLIQGYHGRFSHTSLQSQFALDFKMRLGDTITSVADGVVVGLIEDYSQHGTSKLWKNNDRSNFITIYHPASGLYSQYVHLQCKGALVEMGELVREGQPIGLSGLTGYTTTPHLHFSMKYPTERDGLVSVVVPFKKKHDEQR